MKEVNEKSYAGAHYLCDKLLETGKFSICFDKPFLKEFAVKTTLNRDTLLKHLEEKGFLAGIPIEGTDDALLFCVTEKRTREVMKYYDKLIFEISKPGRIGYSLQQSDFGNYSLTDLPQSLRRGTEAELPEASELDVVRHYTNVSNKNFGVETGFYPLGSCTMKYNPKINEEMASMESFTALHPLQSENSIQGALRLYYELAHALSEISGLAEFTLNPFAGAHGELTGLMLMRQYHIKRGDLKRTKVIVPDSAHGTNPASAAVCGLEIVEVPSTPEGTIDVTKLEPLLDDTIAGIMMTNPNTLGIFEKEIPQIAELVHGCGGLLYYDGANLNPLLGRCRPGDMGFDIMHINLHKTFSTPHGGGGPGSGPVGVSPALVDYLPRPRIVKKGDKYSIEGGNDSMGRISGFFGNFGVMMRAYAYPVTGKRTDKTRGRVSDIKCELRKRIAERLLLSAHRRHL